MAQKSSPDLDKLHEKVLEWCMTFRRLLIQETSSQVKISAMIKERQALQSQLNESSNVRERLTVMLRDLVKNYKDLVPIIEVKRQLATEVNELKEKIKDMEKAHAEKVAELEVVCEDLRKKNEELKAEASEQAKKQEAAHQQELEKKDKDIRDATVLADEIEAFYENKIAEMKKENHKELEQLRNKITQLQQNRSSLATSNMDMISNKLQAVRQEYDVQLEAMRRELEESTSKSSKLEEEVEALRQALRHQKLLSVVREVSTSGPNSVTSKEPGTPVCQSGAKDKELQSEDPLGSPGTVPGFCEQDDDNARDNQGPRDDWEACTTPRSEEFKVPQRTLPRRHIRSVVQESPINSPEKRRQTVQGSPFTSPQKRRRTKSQKEPKTPKRR